ncbi:MAG: LysR family transcriptional regulator [Burkholderiales bacterium RIFCSPLOWO2_12_67_14]|nr:MAG: LysR family transcriptional regulator [Burkholderiales bacterium RIFCSPLOWO2_02_FULL_67_64]OGB40814.1 MAG: LysR family transcriptional regulator [Burkholderiales bacterium RIFCSPHIGHO2_12_FULL_67_38]OGB50998.1 MAG: LysR family transcriptional regulator [Burkholderiales bacterium RIFCSPLOWO2_12_67_14]OGB86767.1 MAG: LysR family transcriptional regulator [Burkholderiales bacterium RIFCSPLOWO2_12_FULL_67_210]
MSTYNHWFIRARLKTRQLLLLVALAEEGNIHRAAQVLSMTQPAASKLLKDLEDVLEVSLFDRLPRGMRPTWYGETMIRHARMALASLNQAHDELNALKTGHYGQVGIGAITSPGLTLLPAAVALVKQEHPSLRISLDIETSPVLLDRLEQGALDIVVGRLFAEHDKTHLRYEPLTEELICAIARPGHPLSGMSGLTLRDVLAAGWIVPPAGSVLRHRFDLMFQQDGLAPPINTIESSALLFITRMLQQSDMVAVLAADVAHYYASHGLVTVLPLDMPCHMDAFGIITRTDRLLSPAAKVMMKALKQTSMAQYGRQLE